MSGQRIADIVARLEQEGEQTATFFQSLTPEQLDMQVYADGAQWSVRQVLAHFVTIERSMHHLFDNMLAGGEGGSRDFDLERYNRSQPPRLDGLSPDELIARFKDVRAGTVAIVAGMRETDLDREGWHPFLGAGRLERFVRWAYEHACLHEEDIRRALGK
jgi:uncharacterized protein (TIGR03083 family)